MVFRNDNTGLTPGKTYKLTGVLMDKATGGKLLVEGKEVTAEKEFTPESTRGTEEITFTFDASALAGKAVVVFETLTLEGREIAVHADINDEGQTVEFIEPEKPYLETEATVNGEKETDPLDEVTITDKVSYFNILSHGKNIVIDEDSDGPSWGLKKPLQSDYIKINQFLHNYLSYFAPEQEETQDIDRGQTM